MTELAELCKDIEKAKSKLIKHARRYGIHENFGQKEHRKLSDVYNTYDWDNRDKMVELDKFHNWMINFDLSQL